MTQPLCARLDDDTAERVYFGRRTSSGYQQHQRDDVEFARHLCGACPLRQQCLDDALRAPEIADRYGIRAGLLPAERKALRARYVITVKSTGEEWRGGPVGRRQSACSVDTTPRADS